jgi:hypothetical protein
MGGEFEAREGKNVVVNFAGEIVACTSVTYAINT